MAELYKTLNLLPTARPEEIRAAHARERERLLADNATDREEIAEQLLAVDEAYATLSDPNRRAAYDRSLGIGSAGGALVLATQPTAVVAPQAPPAPIVQQACPQCGALNPIQATMCSECGKQVSRPCPTCGRPVVLGQTVCSRCNTFIPEYDQRRFAEGVAAEQRVQQVRIESDVRVQSLEATHRVQAVQGVIFWLVVLGLCIGLMALAGYVFYYFLNLRVSQ